MKSYQAHLQSIHPQTLQVSNRSSAIFPVLEKDGVHTRILFVNYWKLKRNIQHLEMTLFLRDFKGSLILTLVRNIDDICAYNFEIKNFLNRFLQQNFIGTVEIEFTSTENLVFSYPGIIVNYYGEQFNTFVHASQRIFNDIKDKSTNAITKVQEGGFTIYPIKNSEPFISLINGNQTLVNFSIDLTLTNSNNNSYTKSLQFQEFLPYELKLFYPSEWVDFSKFLNNKPATGSIRFSPNHTFPRLIVGNRIQNNPQLSVTHTYYDLRDSKETTDYWEIPSDQYDPAILMLPVCPIKNSITAINFYPLYSPCHLQIDMQLFNNQGNLIKEFTNVLELESSKHKDSFVRLEINPLLKSYESSLKQPLFIRLIAKPKNSSKLPSRIKIGFDWQLNQNVLPCNICTNFEVANEDLLNKTSAFRWLPVLQDKNYVPYFTLHNSYNLKNYAQVANITLSYYREKDEEVMTQTYTLPPNGSLLQTITPELKKFLNNSTGWCTITSDNPHISSFYFTISKNGMVGGDHGF